MANNKKFRFGPVAITNAVTNLLNPPTATGGTNGGSSAQVIYLKHIRVVNKTNAVHNFTLYIGATGASAAGTEFCGVSQTVAANSSYDYYASGDGVRLDSADFLTGVADANTSLVISGEGEIGVSG